MKRKKVIMVDVDLTIVDTITTWYDWFEKISSVKINPKDIQQYDLIPYMTSILTERNIHNVNPFLFWHQKDLYDEMEPIEGCKAKLDQWNDEGHHIVFASKCVPEHINSKKRMLQHYFPYMSGFIDTAEKWYLQYDVMIDDNEKLLNRCKKHNPHAWHHILTQLYHENLPCLISGHEDEVSHWNDIKL